jgi:energy-converting hydrogenase A subunit M
MKTFILTLDEPQEDVIKALAKALKIDIQIIDDADEDRALFIAMEDGKRYGRLSEVESKTFLDSLGK